MSEQAKNSAPQDNKSNPIGALEQDVKILSAIGYIGLLFLVPYLVKPKDKFAVFHANQGLLLLIATVVINAIGSIIPVIGWFIVLPLGGIFTLVLFILGIISALKGEEKRLPLIGNFDLLKVQN